MIKCKPVCILPQDLQKMIIFKNGNKKTVETYNSLCFCICLKFSTIKSLMIYVSFKYNTMIIKNLKAK